MTDTVLFTHSQGVATVTFNRAVQRNAVNIAVCDALRDIFDEIEGNPAIHATILTGDGTAFSAGMDLKAFIAGDGDAMLFGKYGFGGFVNRTRTKPVIAAVNGAALAGGFEIMLACDLVVAATGAIFGLPESKLGLVAGAGGAMRLAQRVPRLHANKILLTGETFNATHAMNIGLVNDVVEPDMLMPHATQLANTIAANAPLSVQSSMRLSDAAFKAMENWDMNDREFHTLSNTNDGKEGANAFIQKRKPIWTGE
jgi:enoyl-CoA hydratase